MAIKMGTNYYLRFNICEVCGRYDKQHIGKDSAGWRFLFRFKNGFAENINDWRKQMNRKDAIIVDEYGEEIKQEEFWELVRSKQKGKTHFEMRTIDDFDFYEGEFS